MNKNKVKNIALGLALLSLAIILTGIYIFKKYNKGLELNGKRVN